MPIKKSNLYGSLWASCDELRSGMDAKDEMAALKRWLELSETELAERYATPLLNFTEEAETQAARVNEHVKKMGASWN